MGVKLTRPASSTQTGREQVKRRRRNFIAPSQLFEPLLRDSTGAVDRAGQLSRDGGGGVRILAKVRGQQDGVAERARPPDAPERCFQAVHDVA